MSFAAAFVALLKRSEVLVFAPVRHDGHAPTGAGSHRGMGGPVRLRPGALGVVGVAAAQRARGQPLSVLGAESFLLAASHSHAVLLLKPGQWTEARRGGAARGASVPRTQPGAPGGLSCFAPAPKEAAETWTGVWLVEWPVFYLEREGDRGRVLDSHQLEQQLLQLGDFG